MIGYGIVSFIIERMVFREFCFCTHHHRRRGQFGVLQYLEEHPKVSQKQAEAFKIDRTTMVSQIDYLEEIQCVQRVRNPKNRGFFALRVTKQAKEKLR